jgi:hypothetical protein
MHRDPQQSFILSERSAYGCIFTPIALWPPTHHRIASGSFRRTRSSVDRSRRSRRKIGQAYMRSSSNAASPSFPRASRANPPCSITCISISLGTSSSSDRTPLPSFCSCSSLFLAPVVAARPVPSAARTPRPTNHHVVLVRFTYGGTAAWGRLGSATSTPMPNVERPGLPFVFPSIGQRCAVRRRPVRCERHIRIFILSEGRMPHSRTVPHTRCCTPHP